MAGPRRGDEVALKRVVRYLRLHPRWVTHYPWQDPVSELVIFSDSDWGDAPGLAGLRPGAS